MDVKAEYYENILGDDEFTFWKEVQLTLCDLRIG